MLTYISTLRKLSLSPTNIKNLNRDNILDSYLLEVKSKLSLGFKLDDNILNQTILKKYNIINEANNLKKETSLFNNHVKKMSDNFDINILIDYLKNNSIGDDRLYKLYNNYNFVKLGNKVSVYYKLFKINEIDLYNYNIDTNMYILKV